MTELIIPRENARIWLEEQVEKGQRLKALSIDSLSMLESARYDLKNWDLYNAELIKRMFNTEEYSSEYQWKKTFSYGRAVKLPAKVATFRKEIDESIQKIVSIIMRLDLVSEVANAGSLKLTPEAVPVRLNSNKVFIVHGHDVGSREELARFVELLGLESVVLHEKANSGKTIIEKFEQNSDAAFAVVLLTPDDVGCKKDEEFHQSSRARQNVIFELGYFFAKLGRERVAAIVKGNIEKPSDISGVMYIDWDVRGAWKMELIRELRAAGLNVDHSRVI